MSQPATPEQIAGTAEQLISLIAAENELLDTRQPHRLADTEARKQGLIESYQSGVQLLRSGRLVITGTQRKVLLDTGARLEGIMIEHARKVARMKSINEGLIQVVADRAEKVSAPSDGYGANGAAQRASLARNAYRRPTALSVNRVI